MLWQDGIWIVGVLSLEVRRTDYRLMGELKYSYETIRNSPFYFLSVKFSKKAKMLHFHYLTWVGADLTLKNGFNCCSCCTSPLCHGKGIWGWGKGEEVEERTGADAIWRGIAELWIEKIIYTFDSTAFLSSAEFSFSVCRTLSGIAFDKIEFECYLRPLSLGKGHRTNPAILQWICSRRLAFNAICELCFLVLANGAQKTGAVSIFRTVSRSFELRDTRTMKRRHTYFELHWRFRYLGTNSKRD